MKSLPLDNPTLLDFFIKNKTNQTNFDLEELIVKLDINSEIAMTKDLVRNQSCHRFFIKNIIDKMSPLSAFPTNEAKTFKEHFETIYGMHTCEDNQALVEVDRIQINMNYINQNTLVDNIEKTNKSLMYKTLFIVEHLLVLPFMKKYVKALSMLPAIFQRSNSIQKALKLKILIENSITLNSSSKKVFYDF